MKIDRFEDLDCWKEARILVNRIYQLCRQHSFSKDYRLMDQIVGSGISILNNIAEGFDSQSNNEFIGTCLYIASDQAYLSSLEFKEILAQAEKSEAGHRWLFALLKEIPAIPTKLTILTN